MLQEYALEPSLLNNWSDFRFYMSQFGFDQGRLIALYPKKWKRLVYESLHACRELERARIEEALRRIDHRTVKRRASCWEQSRDWLANAEAEHSNLPFWAIIAEANQRSHPAVIIGASLDDSLDWEQLAASDSRRLWKARRSTIVNRDAGEMAAVIAGFLKYADQVLFVDAHFGPENVRHREPFREFMQKLYERPDGRMPSRIEVHCIEKSEKNFFRDQCNMQLAGMIPEGLTVHFCRWSKDDLHNRFVLTDRGGVAFLEGLDQYTGNGRKEDVAVLQDIDVTQKIMRDYSLESSRFELKDDCEIVGTRRLSSH